VTWIRHSALGGGIGDLRSLNGGEDLASTSLCVVWGEW